MDQDDSAILQAVEDKLGIAHEFKTPNKPAIKKISDNLKNKAPSMKVTTKTTKKQLLEKIEAIVTANGHDFDPTFFKKHSKDDLIRVLGELINHGLDEQRGITDEQITESLGDFDEDDYNYELYEEADAEEETVLKPMKVRQVKQAQAQPNRVSIEAGAKSLYQLNLLLSTVIEKASAEVGPELTGYKIDGYTQNLKVNQPELMDLYREIYKEHMTELSKYIDPVNTVIMLNAGALTASIVKAESAEVKKS